MHPIIPSVCEAITAPTGAELLVYLRSVYQGRADKAVIGATHPDVVRQADDLGLTEPGGPGRVLTTPGYLVGNVAKEYCNWVDDGRELPPPRPSLNMLRNKDVVDLGCSFGRWVWGFQKAARSAVGIEMQQEYIELGRALAQLEGEPVPDLRHGSAEDLDQFLPDGSVDFIFSRLAFNHVRIRPTLAKAARALRSKGVIWLEVETFSVGWRKIFQGERRLRSMVFSTFGAANSLALIATGRQLTLRVPGRMHSEHKPAYPTVAWWRAALAGIGLTDFHAVFKSPDLLAFWAQKP